MASLGDSSTFHTAIDPSFSGFCCLQLYSEDAFLLSEGEHLAATYEMKTRRPLKCWTFPQLSLLTCPVIFDGFSNKFVSVQQKAFIKYFVLEEDADTVKKVKLSSSITCLLPHPGAEALVLYETGFFQPLSEAIEKRDEQVKPQIIEHKEVIQSARFLGSEVCLLTKTAHNEKVFYRLSTEASGELKTRRKRIQLSVDYKLWAIDDKGALLGLSASSQLYKTVDEKETFVLQLLEKPVELRSCVSLEAKDNQLVAIVSRDESKASFYLQIVDMKYKVVILRKSLSLEPLAHGLHVVNSVLYILCSKGIEMIPFRTKPTSLSSVFGKGSAANETQTNVTLHVAKLCRSIESLSPTQISEELDKIGTQCGPQMPEKLLAKAIAVAAQTLAGPSEADAASLDTLLGRIVSYSFNPTFLTTQVRALHLSVEQSLSLISKLINKVNESQTCSTECANIFDWISVVLDAEFKQLLVSPKETLKTLIELKETTEGYCGFYEMLENVRQLTEVILTTDYTESPRIELPTKGIGSYAIELVYL